MPGRIWKDLCQHLIWAGKCPQSLQAEALSIHELEEDTQGGSQCPMCGKNLHTMCPASPQYSHIYICRVGIQDLNRQSEGSRQG